MLDHRLSCYGSLTMSLHSLPAIDISCGLPRTFARDICPTLLHTGLSNTTFTPFSSPRLTTITRLVMAPKMHFKGCFRSCLNCTKKWRRILELKLVAQSQSQPRAPNRPTLILLPPEIRNEIWRAVLVETDAIEIPSTGPRPTPPALLQTCRRVREEGIWIYLRDNTFSMLIQEFDARMYLSWIQFSPLHMDCNLQFDMFPSTNWKALLYWLEAHYYGETDEQYPQSNAESRQNLSQNPPLHQDAAIKLFETVDKITEAQIFWPRWTEAREILETIHEVLTAMDPAWA